MRFRIVLLLFALAVAGTASGSVLGSGNPTGQWATPKAAQAVILSRAIGVSECFVAGANGGACKIGRPANQLRVVNESVARVVSANVTGIGPYKLVNGVRRYQLFKVRACTIYHYRGAHRWGVDFRWFTRRPPGGTIKTDDRNGGVLVKPDSGEPYARDWNYPLFAPLARDHC